MEKREIKRPIRAQWLLTIPMLLLLFTVSLYLPMPVCAAEGKGIVIAQDSTGKIIPLTDAQCAEAYKRDVTYKRKDDVKMGCFDVPAGMKITLTATPDADSTFGGWSGACTHKRKVCVFTMDRNKYIRWRFNLKM